MRSRYLFAASLGLLAMLVSSTASAVVMLADTSRGAIVFAKETLTATVKNTSHYEVKSDTGASPVTGVLVMQAPPGITTDSQSVGIVVTVSLTKYGV